MANDHLQIVTTCLNRQYFEVQFSICYDFYTRPPVNNNIFGSRGSCNAVVLNLLSFKSRLKASFETKVPVKEICQLLVAVMFQYTLFFHQNTKKMFNLLRKKGIRMKFMSNLG